MTKKGKRLIIALIAIFAVIAVAASVLLGMWYGTDVIQKGIIRIMCKDTPSSVPENYDEILNETVLTTEEYAEGLTLDRIEPNALPEDAVCVLVFHGGYYVGGGRHNQEPYARLIASNGFRVFNVDYSLAPESVYPTQLKEANAALLYAARKYPAAKGFVVSGDSAGAHLAAQLAAVVGSEELRRSVGIGTSVPKEKLLGFVGNCGFYQASEAADTGFFLIGDALNMLLGVKNYKEYEKIGELDLENYASAFPSALLICGDKDPFLKENERFRDALQSAGVRTETYFPASGKNDLGHEFQCNYEFEESYAAAEKIVAFLGSLG